MKFYKQIFTLILILSSMLVYGQTEQRDLPSFNSLALSTAGTVYLRQGSTQKVELKGPKDVLEETETEVKNGKLVISHEGSWFGGPDMSDLEVYITMTDIEKLSVSGSGKIISEDQLQAYELKLAISGSGKMDLKAEAQSTNISISGSGTVSLNGKSNNVKASVSGSGKIKAAGFQAASYKVNISGSGGCEIAVEESLDAHISGSGSVAYKGNPQHVESKTSGSGKIRKL